MTRDVYKSPRMRVGGREGGKGGRATTKREDNSSGGRGTDILYKEEELDTSYRLDLQVVLARKVSWRVYLHTSNRISSGYLSNTFRVWKVKIEEIHATSNCLMNLKSLTKTVIFEIHAPAQLHRAPRGQHKWPTSIGPTLIHNLSTQQCTTERRKPPLVRSLSKWFSKLRLIKLHPVKLQNHSSPSFWRR